ncbi:MAG: phosphatidylinositol mannoside acyltransferase [Actinomycetota bacterium]
MAPNLALLGFRTVALAARTLPRTVMSGICAAVTAAIPRLDPARGEIAARNLERSHGRRLGDDERRSGVRSVFRSYARYWTDSTRLPSVATVDLDRGFSYEGYEHIEDALATGNGMMLVLAHLGGFEYAGSWLSKVAGHDVSAVVEALDNEEVREFMYEWRSGAGMQVLPLDKGLAGELVRRLKANHVVCLMSDRNLGDGGVEVEFFGETTELPGGAATLALRTGAQIIPVAIYHDGDKNHAICEPAIPAERQAKRMRDDVARITQDIAHVLEMQIRRAPTQWMLLQPNWPSDLPDDVTTKAAEP